jgi:HlyD family secretion protein
MRLNQFFPKAINSVRGSFGAGRALATAGADDLPLAVLEFQSPTAAVIATPIPRTAGWTNYFITIFVALMLVIAAVMPIDRLVTAHGILVAGAPSSTIQAFNAASIVETMNVHPGEIVSKGQVLATLNPTYATADINSETSQEQAYAAQVARLTAQENNQPYTGDPANPASALQVATYAQQEGQYSATIEDNNQKIKALQTTIDGYNAQAVYYRQRLAIASKVEAMRKKLQALQVGSELDTEAATDDRVNVQSELASATSSAAAAERNLASQVAERDSFDAQWRATVSQQLSEAQNNLAQAQQALAKAKLDDQLVVLKAPQDSIVQSVAAISEGSVLAAGQELMHLTPVDAPLAVEANINAEESGYVHVGDLVNVKFDTLPYLQFGYAKGIVTSISPESFNPLDTQNAINGPPLPGQPQSLYYKAAIAINVINLHNVPPGFRLVPGMPLEADMKVGKRTALSYFTQRMLPVAYNSLHEP